MKGFVLLVAVVSSIGVFGQVEQPLSPAQTLPSFSFVLRDGRAFTNKDLPAGKPVFFVLFDPTCPHCQRAVRSMDDQAKAFNKATVCLVSMDSWDKMDMFVASNGPHLKGMANVRVMRDPQYMFIGRFKPRKFPAMELFAADGKLLDYEDNAETVFRIVRMLK
jgi:thiol-disulfide isomerase/thioredoxin